MWQLVSSLEAHNCRMLSRRAEPDDSRQANATPARLLTALHGQMDVKPAYTATASHSNRPVRRTQTLRPGSLGDGYVIHLASLDDEHWCCCPSHRDIIRDKTLRLEHS
jgi:hypothetical protein